MSVVGVGLIELGYFAIPANPVEMLEALPETVGPGLALHTEPVELGYFEPPASLVAEYSVRLARPVEKPELLLELPFELLLSEQFDIAHLIVHIVQR